MTLLYDRAKVQNEKYRYLAEWQKNDNIDDWIKAT
jgi:hypothetical protein